METSKYTRKDFASEQDVRWCPGCGDYSILAAVQKVMPDIVQDKAKQVFISGIGCASRFPYYMNTYGMHSIHGRAPAFATGVKVMNPELDVWVVAGDGDALSIGGNHILHLVRRNVDLNFLLINNQVYGLTKGQYSPTSHLGSKLKSTPLGSVDRPLSPLKLALGANANFIARTADVLAKHMQAVLKEAYLHKGTSLIEIYQNCHIFNNDVFKDVLDKQIRDDQLLFVEDGKPMIFGKEADRGIRLNPGTGRPEVVLLKNIPESEILIHDASNPDPCLHFALACMAHPFPTVMGVIRKIEASTYEDDLELQEKHAASGQGKGKLMDLLYSGETWKV